MKLSRLRELLAQLGPEHDDREITLEGCDCVGDFAAVDARGSAEIFFCRARVPVDAPGWDVLRTELAL